MAMRKNVFVLCSSQDADRLESIYQANYSTKPCRPFVCDSFQAETIDRIAQEYKGLGLHYQFDKGVVYVYDYNPVKNKGLVAKMKDCGFTMLIRCSDKFAEWIDDILKFCNKEETVDMLKKAGADIMRKQTPLFSPWLQVLHRA